MFLVAGLPLDGYLSRDILLRRLQRKDQHRVYIMDVPDIPIKHFNRLMSLAEDLKALEKLSADLLTDFLKQIQKYSHERDYRESCQMIGQFATNFRWASDRLKGSTVCRIFTDLKDQIESLKFSLKQRVGEAIRCERTLKAAEKALDGAVHTLEVPETEHDFLHEHYVLVSADRTKDFLKFIEVQLNFSKDACEVHLSDDEHFIYRIYGLKSKADSDRQILQKGGWQVKKAVKAEDLAKKRESLGDLQGEAESSITNLGIYLKTNFPDVLSLYMHARILHLYSESVLAYGLGPLCIFAAEDLVETRLVTYFQNICEKWDLSQRFTPESDLDDCPYIIIKNPVDPEEN